MWEYLVSVDSLYPLGAALLGNFREGQVLYLSAGPAQPREEKRGFLLELSLELQGFAAGAARGSLGSR